MASTGSTPALHLWPNHGWLMLPVLWATLIINILGLALPLAALQIYDRIMAESTPGRWLIMLIGVLVAVVAEGLLRLARAHVIGHLGSQQEQRLTLHLLGRILRGRNTNQPGQHLYTLEALGRLREFSSGQALTVLLEIPFAVVYLGLMAYLGGILVLVPLGLLLIFAGQEVGHGHALARHMAARDKIDVVRKNMLLDIFGRLHSSKAMGHIRLMQRRLESQQAKVEQAALPIVQTAANAYQDGLMFSQLMLAAVTLAGAPLVLNGHMTLGSLIACVLVSGRLMAPIQRGLGLYSRVQEALLSRDRVAAVLAVPPVFGTAPTPRAAADATTRPDYPGSLELVNIGLRAETPKGPGKWLLRTVTLQAERGQTIALHTPHETTSHMLLQVLAGLAEPADGHVYLNGHQPHTLAAAELAEQVGYLPPHGVIYRGTLYDNLSRFGHTPAAHVSEMIELLDLQSSIAVLPQGLDTPLTGTLADPLPPSTKQRVALARILAMKPRVLLFDHAERNLDPSGYNTLYRLLERLKGKTLTILATADNNLTALADTHWVQRGTTLKRQISPT